MNKQFMKILYVWAREWGEEREWDREGRAHKPFSFRFFPPRSEQKLMFIFLSSTKNMFEANKENFIFTSSRSRNNFVRLI